jgi:hypothetical protein
MLWALLVIPAAATASNGAASSLWAVSTIGGSGTANLEDIQACRIDKEQHRDGAGGASKFAAPTRTQVVNGTVYVMDGMNGCVRSIKGGMVGSLTPCCTDDIGTGSGHGQMKRGTGDGGCNLRGSGRRELLCELWDRVGVRLQ